MNFAGEKPLMLVGFLLVVLLLLGMAILSLVVIRQMDRQVDDLNLLQEKVSHAQQMIYLITAQSHYRAMALLTGDESWNAEIATAKQEFLGRLDAVERMSPQVWDAPAWHGLYYGMAYTIEEMAGEN